MTRTNSKLITEKVFVSIEFYWGVNKAMWILWAVNTEGNKKELINREWFQHVIIVRQGKFDLN